MKGRMTRMGCAAVLVGLAALSLDCKDSSVAPREAEPSAVPRFAATNGVTSQTHFVANGDEGYFSGYYYEEDSFGWEWLDVWRTGSTNAQQPYLYYWVSRCNLSGTTCTYQSGWGYIQNGDFSGGQNGLRLHTNTANLSSFYNENGPGGPIEVTWKPDGNWTEDHSGNDTYRYNYYTQLRRGNWSSASAAVSGNVLGSSLPPNGDASIRSTHSIQIDIWR